MHQLYGTFQRIGVDTHVDVDEADVRVGGVLRLDAVGEAVFLANAPAMPASRNARSRVSNVPVRLLPIQNVNSAFCTQVQNQTSKTGPYGPVLSFDRPKKRPATQMTVFPVPEERAPEQSPLAAALCVKREI